jgi:hypothetical protein
MGKTYKDRNDNLKSSHRGSYNRNNRKKFKNSWKKKDWSRNESEEMDYKEELL